MGQRGPLSRTIPHGGRLRRYTLCACLRTVLALGLHTSDDVRMLTFKAGGAPAHVAHSRVAQALANAGVKLVPDIVAGGGALGGGTLVDVLLASVIRDRNGMSGAAAAPGHSLEKVG
jgi:hypothetical protein